MSESVGTFGSLGKGFVQDYTDLLAYRMSFKLSKEICEVTKQFPKEEVYSLADQFRRAIRPKK
jgi:hypothetical protein